MDGSSTGRCYKTMLIKSYINYSLQFLMVFFFRCCFFCCREFWMEYFFVDFFNALCIYIYIHTPFFFGWQLSIREDPGTPEETFFPCTVTAKMTCPKDAACLVFNNILPANLPFQVTQASLQKTWAFHAYIYISLTWGFTTRRWKDANAATDHHSARGRCWSVEGSQGL